MTRFVGPVAPVACMCANLDCTLLQQNEWHVIVYTCNLFSISQITAILASLLVASVVIITLLMVVIHLLCLLRRDQRAQRKERWILVSLLQGGCNLSKCAYGKLQCCHLHMIVDRKHFTALILLLSVGGMVGPVLPR